MGECLSSYVRSRGGPCRSPANGARAFAAFDFRVCAHRYSCRRPAISSGIGRVLCERDARHPIRSNNTRAGDGIKLSTIPWLPCAKAVHGVLIHAVILSILAPVGHHVHRDRGRANSEARVHQTPCHVLQSTRRGRSLTYFCRCMLRLRCQQHSDQSYPPCHRRLPSLFVPAAQTDGMQGAMVCECGVVCFGCGCRSWLSGFRET